MKIYDFDTKKGIYHFQFDDLTTENHAHPVIEIIYATSGTFSLRSNEQMHQNITFAIIDSNIEHKVESKDCVVEVLMIESYNLQLSTFLTDKKVILQNGIFIQSNFEEKHQFLLETRDFAITHDLRTPINKRIAKSIELIEENELDYDNLISELTSEVLLSNSRLSHLFKEHIGVSIKKYLVWNKLKQAINLYLDENTNLTDISIESGFFDQAHFTNSFKKILGVSPSKAYNSRILQS